MKKIRLRDRRVEYSFIISVFLIAILFSSATHSTIFSSAQPIISQSQTNEKKFEPIFYQKMNSMIQNGEIRYYDVIFWVKKDAENGMSPDSISKMNRDNLENLLVNSYNVTNVYEGQVLSFVTAEVPLQKISKLANYDYIIFIGDGEAEVPATLNVAKKTINADYLNFTINGITVNGSGVIVSDVGSGIRQNHTDLPVGTKIINQVHCLQNGQCVHDGNYTDDVNHDTHVAGIIAGLGKIDGHLSGVAKGASLLNAHLFTTVSSPNCGAGCFSTASIVSGIDWSVSNHARVINLSLGAVPCNGLNFRLASEEAVDEGTVVVASSGNSGPNLGTVGDPACAFNSIAVGAINDNNTNQTLDDSMATFSSRGPILNSTITKGILKPELVAPGVQINSADKFSNYSEIAITGTSFSAPMVSGAVALLLQTHPEYTPVQVKAALLEGAKWNPFNNATFPSTASEYENNGSANISINAVGFGLLDVNKTLTLANTGKNIIQDTIVQGAAKTYAFSANKNDQVKVILSWLQHPTGNVTNPTNPTPSNLNFNITRSDGILIAASNSKNQTNEFVVFNATVKDTYIITVNATSVSPQIGSIETFALASDHALTRGSFLVKAGSFTKPTSLSVPITQNVTLPFKPKALILFTSGLDSSGFSDVYKFSLGFSNGTSSRADGLSSGDALPKSHTGRAFGKNIVEILANSGVGTAAEANVTKFNINNFTIKWTKNDNRATMINYLALGGNDLTKVSVSSFVAQAAAGNQTIKTGFRPDLVMFMHAAKPNETLTSDNAYIAYGFAMPSKRNSIAIASVNNTTPTNTCEFQRTDRALYTIKPSTCLTTNQFQIDNVYFNNTAFIVHWLSPPPTSDKIYYMALQGGAYDLGNFTQPTSTVPVKQTIKETIQPNALMLSSFNGIASTILKSNNRISFGTSDNTTSIGVWTGDRSLASNSITARSENTTRVITLATEQATGANSITNATASVVTMNATGFTLNWTKDDSVARQILYTTFGRNPIDNDIIITEKTIPTSMTNFTFTSTTLTPSSFNLANYANSNDTKIFANLLPGTYNMTQNANKNYTTTYSCNDGSPTKAIKLKSGQTITCTFVNTLTKKDIVVTNGRYQNVTVLSGNGTGRFGAITEFNASNNFPASLAVADFNGDGNLDIVAPSSAFSDNISILLNNGTGGFGSPQVFSAGGITATSVATADFNNDGKQDVVVSEGGSNNIEILLGNGTGGLGNPASFSVGSGSVDPVGVATADFNNDGKQDVVTADLVPNKISVLLGNGTGGFGTAKLFGTGGTSPYGIATADFNNDGKQDVVTTNSQSNNVSIFIGNGTGGFSSITTYGIGGTAPYGVAVGDVNGDGKLDIVTANQISNNTSVLLGDGSGGFGSPTMFNVGANAPSSVGLGDFNNDGKLDIVTVNTDLYNTSISVLLGNGTGGFGTPKVTTLSGLHSFCCTSVAVADFNPGH